MKTSVEYRVNIRIEKSNLSFDSIQKMLDEMKKRLPEIETITTATFSRDEKTNEFVYFMDLIGKIIFRQGVVPNLERLNRLGRECVGDDFRAVPMFFFDKSKKEATVA